MARTVATTSEALRDLKEIHAYVARDNPAAAKRLVRMIRRKFRTIATFPESGSACDNVEPGLRSVPAGNYVIFYKALPDGVQIVRVAHGARS
jgi:toxin ParE1/3/4